jgi:hypothetical protein
VTGLQRDDVQVGAGDGTRTRDSLLGRQELYRIHNEFCHFERARVLTSGESATPIGLFYSLIAVRMAVKKHCKGRCLGTQQGGNGSE